MIRVTNSIRLDEGEVQVSFIRASGPGGQNVNKVATAAQLRFDVRGSPSLTEPVKVRLARLAGRRLTLDGEIVITAQRFRTQELNRADAVERLVELIRRAAVAPKARKPTRPTRASKEKRLETKQRRGATKRLRGAPGGME